MAFSQATITSILPVVPQGSDLKISWTSTSPAGTLYQLYINRALTDATTNKYSIIPAPQGQISIEVGTVGTGQGGIDFSGDLPPAPTDKVELEWYGGTFEDPLISGFYVYLSDTPGGPVDYAVSVANVSAYTGPPTDGWNLGPWNIGSWGYSAASYSWTSGVLTNGLWSCAVVPYDAAGNLGAASTTSVYVQAAPIEVSPFADGSRLHYSYNSSTAIATITWNASPSA